MSHTEGKLISDENCIETEFGEILCYIEEGDSDAINEANARRLVACWNWFESLGVSTEDIERRVNLSDKVRQERDEALAVLRDVESELSSTLGIVRPAVRRRIEAILRKHKICDSCTDQRKCPDHGSSLVDYFGD